MTNKVHSKSDALIFDMDGTLWDAVETYTLAWNQFFTKNGIKKVLKKTDLDALMGLEESIFLKKVLPEFSADKRSILYEEVIQIQYELIDKVGGIIYDGVLEHLPALAKKYSLFIVSNCPRDTIKHFMKFAQIEHLITNSLSHGENYKPKHENISSLIDAYDLKNPVYIGDTMGDMEQSLKANVAFVFMSYGFGSCDTFDKSFSSFEAFALYYLNA